MALRCLGHFTRHFNNDKVGVVSILVHIVSFVSDLLPHHPSPQVTELVVPNLINRMSVPPLPVDEYFVTELTEIAVTGVCRVVLDSGFC